MNEVLIENWNKVVGIDDDIYVLGDMCLTNDNKKTKKILQRLTGRIFLIKGNHEKSVLNKQDCRDRFDWIKDYYELVVNDSEAPRGQQLLVLCHYAFRVWRDSHKNSFSLHGHNHHSMAHIPWGRSMDVGVDSAYKVLGEYKPFNYMEIRSILSKRGDNPIDYHIANR